MNYQIPSMLTLCWSSWSWSCGGTSLNFEIPDGSSSLVQPWALKFYKWQIYDILGNWVGSPELFSQFKQDLHGYCKLNWKTTLLLQKQDFLDLMIEIRGDDL
eukprot:11291275-Ditylum_brightwellii.AAC.1